MRKICVVTGTRAEFGLLQPLIQKLKGETSFEVELLITGTHLSPEFGKTIEEIQQAGFSTNHQVEIILSSDSEVGVAKSMGLAILGIAEHLQLIQPDLLIVLGDRFEVLAAAQTALIFQIPIAHLHGGELSFGSTDDAMRHAITKMATWHFPSTQEHADRIIQLGESPERVFVAGALGIENILKLDVADEKEIRQLLGLSERPYFLITYHPETISQENGLPNLLQALDPYKVMYDFIFTKANADKGGRLINEQLAAYVKQNPTAQLYDSLGVKNYLSAVQYASVVIGNSSSGLIEVPYFKVPTVNCGMRQLGRQHPRSVITTSLDVKSITQGIREALCYQGEYEQLFGTGDTSTKICTKLKEISQWKVVKGFYDL